MMTIKSDGRIILLSGKEIKYRDELKRCGILENDNKQALIECLNNPNFCVAYVGNYFHAYIRHFDIYDGENVVDTTTNLREAIDKYNTR